METNYPASPRDPAEQAVAPFSPAVGYSRIDGWTPERQRGFCEVLAECGLVREAAAAVGMTAQTAYRLRRRAQGNGFALAWDAALQLARQRLVDLALERAVDGSLETTYDGDGKIVRQRRKQDVRLLLATIGKLDTGQRNRKAVAKIADEFDGFLDCMEADANTVIVGPCDTQSSIGGSPHRVREFLEAREPGSTFDRRDHINMLTCLHRNRTLALSVPEKG
jgi:YD repeat-containing protein